MTEPTKTPEPETPATPAAPTPEQAAKAERARRLAQALRENLRRRKAPRAASGAAPNRN